MSFIVRYVNLGSKCTDAPYTYHFSNALMLLSATVGKKLYIKWGNEIVYANLSMILLGATSRYRKSVSMKIGNELLPEEIHRYPQRTSPEKFEEVLAVNPEGILIKDEFGSWLKLLSKDYMKGHKESLNFWIDGKFSYEWALKSGKGKIPPTYLCIWAGTTQSRLLANMKSEDVESGFAIRFLYILPDYKPEWKPKFPEDDEEESRVEKKIAELKGELKSDLIRLYEYLEGKKESRLELSTEAKRIYNKFNKKMEDRPDDIFTGLRTRITDYVLKFVILVHANNQIENKRKDKCVDIICVEEMEIAIKIGEMMLHQSKKVILEIMGGEESRGFQKDYKRILGHIERKQGINHTDLLNNSNLLAYQLKNIIDTGVQRGDIEIRYEGKRRSAHYYTKVRYKV